MRFLPAEVIVLRVIAFLGVVDAIMISVKGIGIDVVGYLAVCGAGLCQILIGQYYRVARGETNASLALIGGGMFGLFSIAASIFNYMFLPLYFTPIDPLLFRLDAALGYHWPDLMQWVARHAWVGTALYYVYFTSLPQMLGLILFLGFSGRGVRLHRFLLTGVFGALLSIGFWIFFPTFGAKAYYSLPQSVLDAMPLAVDPAYGAELVRLGHQGVAFLSPENVLGLIAFPSFHIVMACMAVYFTPRKHVLFPIALGLNVLMLPAVLVQGGHHLSDIAGGVITFCVALALAHLCERQIQKRTAGSVRFSNAALPAEGL